jgi:hypothetical protein
MKSIKTFVVMSVAFALIGGTAVRAQEEKKECCPATAEGQKACSHDCCKKAGEAGKTCKKCHKEEKKKEENK